MHPEALSHRRTVKIGPASASAVHTTATTRIQTNGASNPNRSIETAFAIRPLAQNSKAVHPISWTRFATDGT
jgi:hypothetical protein